MTDRRVVPAPAAAVATSGVRVVRRVVRTGVSRCWPGLFGLTLAFMARGADSSPPLTVLAMRMASLLLFATAALLRRRGTGGVGACALPALAAIGAADAAANLRFGVASTRGLTSVVSVVGRRPGRGGPGLAR